MKNAVSVYCRLGFARKKNSELEPGTLHPSWKNILNTSPHRTTSVSSVPSDEDPLLAELAAALAELGTPLPSEKEGIVTFAHINVLVLHYLCCIFCSSHVQRSAYG